MKTSLFCGITFVFLGVNSVAIASTLERLRNIEVTDTGINFIASSTGCTTKESFVLENGTTSSGATTMSLTRIKRDLCLAMPRPYPVFYTFAEMELSEGSTFTLLNQVENVPNPVLITVPGNSENPDSPKHCVTFSTTYFGDKSFLALNVEGTSSDATYLLKKGLSEHGSALAGKEHFATNVRVYNTSCDSALVMCTMVYAPVKGLIASTSSGFVAVPEQSGNACTFNSLVMKKAQNNGIARGYNVVRTFAL